MAVKFFALLTNQGAEKLSNMAALGEKLEITSLAVGDGGGVSPTPNQAQTELVNERRRAQLNSLSVDEKNTSQIIAEQIIPEAVGGWWIREIGLFDADGVLIAVANCPETYKATTEEGSGRTQVIRMMLTVSSTDAVTLKVDPSVVLATRQYVDSAVIEVKTYADNVMKKHVAEDNPHSQYPLIENALKELADAGLVGEVLKNLGLKELVAGAVPSTRKINGHALTADINVTAQDIFNDQSIEIGANQNLDNYITPGLYYQSLNVNTSAALNYPENNSGSLMVLRSAGVTQVYRTYNCSRIWSRSKSGTAAWTPWVQEYNTQNKPSAADVGALSLSGGQLNGALGIGTYNGLGGNSIVLGDSDTGLKQNGDGNLLVYADAVRVINFASGGIQSNKSINISGKVNPSDYGNFDSRYVKDVRLGLQSYYGVNNWQTWNFQCPSGHVLSGINVQDTGSNSADNIAGVYYRPVQKYINNTWYNVASV